MSAPDVMPAVEIGQTAFFFDFDGTLAEIAPEPDLVSVKPAIIDSLGLLYEKAAGALAVVSGREIAQIDRYLVPLVLPAAGIHGAELRGADGHIARDRPEPAVLGEVERAIGAFVKQHPGLLAEIKHGSVALHYRQRPEMEQQCRVLVDRLTTGRNLHVLHGKKVVEIRTSGRTKGTAIEAFLAMGPFSGRTPLFAGDDITDEDGFKLVNDVGGLSVKVGPGPTVAKFRLADVASFGDWLTRTSGWRPDPTGLTSEVARR